MRRHFLPIVASLLLVAACTQGASPSPSSSPGASGPDLYAISGASGSIEGTTLTLNGVPSVIWFTDRPERHAGHVSVADFLAGWDPGSGSFAADPPNADVAILGNGVETDSVVELDTASGDSSALTFGVTFIEGSLPDGTFGPTALFIDVCDITYPGCPPL